MQTSICRSGLILPGFRMLVRTASNETFGLLRHGDMVPPRPVAALTVDAFRNLPSEKGGPSEGIASRFDFRIGVVTKHATVMDSPLESMGGNGNRSRDSWPRKTPSRCTSSPEARRACRRGRGGGRSGFGCRNPPRSGSPSPPRSLPCRRTRSGGAAGSNGRPAQTWCSSAWRPRDSRHCSRSSLRLPSPGRIR